MQYTHVYVPHPLVGTAEPTHRVSQSSVNPDWFFGNFGISLENWHHLHYFGIIYTTFEIYTTVHDLIDILKLQKSETSFTMEI